jgi:hypothetical protein
MTDPQPDYFRTFGYFMNQFANVEAMVHALLRRITSLPDKEARVISGGMRLGDVIDITRRLARVRNLPPKPVALMEKAFQQLALIGNLRDKLVHRGASISVSGDEITSSNARTVRFKEDTEILKLSVQDIEAAALDLGVIFIRFLTLYHSGPNFEKAALRAMLKDEPWLYKPRQPETPHRQPREDRKPSGRPQSS